MIELAELRLASLLLEREEHHQPPPRSREQIVMLEAPWPWPWAILERGVPWICYLDLETKTDKNGKALQPQRRVPRLPPEEHNALVAIRCTTPVDQNLIGTLEARGVGWPSCPPQWRGAIVGAARITGQAWAMRGIPAPEVAAFWPSDHPFAWRLSGVMHIAPIPIEGWGRNRLSSFPEELLPELRERWGWARDGLFRHRKLSADGGGVEGVRHGDMSCAVGVKGVTRVRSRLEREGATSSPEHS